MPSVTSKALLITLAHGEQYRLASAFFLKQFGKIGKNAQWLVLDNFYKKNSILKKLGFYYKRDLFFEFCLNILSRFIFFKSRMVFSFKQEFIDFEIKKNFNNQLPDYRYGKKVDNFIDLECFISNYKPDIIYVLGAPLIPKKIINLAPLWINLHIGKLPSYRGLKAIEWAILNNDDDAIVATIHELTPKLDDGPIIEEIKITPLKHDLVNIYYLLYLNGIKKLFDEDLIYKLRKKIFIKNKNKSKIYYSINFNDYYKHKLLKKIDLYKNSIFLVAHNPVQYHSPIYRAIASETILTVHYLSDKGVRAFYSKEQGGYIKWDVDLLHGYESKFHKNFSLDSFKGFFCRINPGIVFDIYLSPHKYIWINGYNYFTLILVRIISSIIGKKILFRGETIPRKHKTDMFYNFIFQLKKFYCKWFLNDTKFILTSCYLNQKAFEQYDIKKDFILLPSAVDTSFFVKNSDRSWTKKKELIIKKPRFITVSRLTKRKQINKSIDILNFLKIRGIKSEFWLVGDGPEKENIRKYAQDKDIDVNFFGFCSQKKVAELMGKSHFFIIMSEYDASPKALNEAAAIGLPLIVSKNVGTCYDIVKENENGLIINNIDQNSLSLIYEFIFKCMYEPNFYLHSCEQSIKIDKTFSIEKNVSKMIKVLKNA